jgi:hypothetical protein
MVVPTGTATPWRELTTWPTGRDSAIFIRDGHVTGSADLLAEALRADGVVRTLGRAIPVAEAAELELNYYGYVDEGDEPVLCTPDGETASGETVDEAFPCVVATVNTYEE